MAIIVNTLAVMIYVPFPIDFCFCTYQTKSVTFQIVGLELGGVIKMFLSAVYHGYMADN